jgi:hypothetical protein
LPEGHRIRPLRCRAGSAMDDGGCPRDATTWMNPKSRDYPLCGEHARAQELWWTFNEWSVAEEATRDWLRVTRAWAGHELTNIALGAHEKAKEGLWKAEAGAELAQEVADAPRKSREDRIADLTPELDAESRRLLNRADALVTVRTSLEDYATGQLPEAVLRRTLGILVDEADKANEEVERYHEEIGIRRKE